jgi:tetratricopeptide (TPR) repeat protein
MSSAVASSDSSWFLNHPVDNFTPPPTDARVDAPPHAGGAKNGARRGWIFLTTYGKLPNCWDELDLNARIAPVMSHKVARKTLPSTVGSGIAMRQEVEKLIHKERLKDAVKQAKLLFKDESTPENHRLLENAYFLRARQLLELGMPDSAREVAGHLLEFGLTSTAWTDEFVRLLINLGLAVKAIEIQARSGSPELKDELVVLAADQAVIHPARMQDVSAETAREASLIRESLEQLTAGDAENGLMLLRDLPRSSPLSDWKFFVRGLAAYYQGNSEEAQTNWSRLDASRKAFVIAKRLQRLAGSGEKNADVADFAALEQIALGEPVLERLAHLPRLLAGKDWERVIRVVVSLRNPLRRLDPKLAERLTQILVAPFLREASELDLDDAERLLKSFTRAAEPLAIDPNWNRFWALASRLTEADTNTVHDCWMRYIHDIETIPALSPTERVLAQAMVWNRVAMLYRNDVEEIDSPDSMFGALAQMFGGAPDEAEVKELRKRAVHCLERSLALAPLHLPTYRLLINLQKCWKNQAGVAAAAQRLLEKFPDDLETLGLLLDSAFQHGRLEEAMSYVQRIRVLKPLDSEIRGRESAIRIGLARHCALAGRWEEGRDHFRCAAELTPDLRKCYTFLARKSLFELRAGQRGESDRLLKEALASLPEPAPLWLVLGIDSSRYQMGAATTSGYVALWESELKKKCQSQTAGEMAALLHAYLELDVQYPGRDSQARQLVAYLTRTSRLKYRQTDIERVCDFLACISTDRELLRRLATKGAKLYPGSARLNFLAGLTEVAKGLPMSIAPAGLQHLEKALQLAETSSVPEEVQLLPTIRQMLTSFKELRTRMGGFPFAGGPFSGWGFDDLDDEDWDEDTMFDDEPRSVPAPKRKRKKKRFKTR